MERLTKRYKNGKAFVSSDHCFDTWSVPKTFEGDAIDRLAHYEDLEEQGRLVELPCAVGDTVWFETYERNATVYKGILPHKIEGYRLCLLVKGTTHTVELPDYAFGDSVFLSKEEAETALAASGKEG